MRSGVMVAHARREHDAGGDAGESLFEMGMKHSTARSDSVDLIAAHMWFNLAAMHGHQAAARLRGEIAAEMSKDEIAAAQQAARLWLKSH